MPSIYQFVPTFDLRGWNRMLAGLPGAFLPLGRHHHGFRKSFDQRPWQIVAYTEHSVELGIASAGFFEQQPNDMPFIIKAALHEGGLLKVSERTKTCISTPKIRKEY